MAGLGEWQSRLQDQVDRAKELRTQTSPLARVPPPRPPPSHPLHSTTASYLSTSAIPHRCGCFPPSLNASSMVTPPRALAEFASPYTSLLRSHVWREEGGDAYGEEYGGDGEGRGSLEEEVEKLEGMVGELEARGRAETEEAVMAAAAAMLDVQAAEQRAEDAERRAEEGEERVREMEETMRVLEAQVEAREEEADALRASVAALQEAAARGRESEVAELRGKVEALEADNGHLGAQIVKLQKINDELRRVIAAGETI